MVDARPSRMDALDAATERVIVAQAAQARAHADHAAAAVESTVSPAAGPAGVVGSHDDQ